MLNLKLKPLGEEQLKLKSAVRTLLTGLGFEVSSHPRMLYGRMGQNDMLLQLNYFAKDGAVTCQLSGFGLYTQLFGVYVISKPEELEFLIKNNRTLTDNFPQLRQ